MFAVISEDWMTSILLKFPALQTLSTLWHLGIFKISIYFIIDLEYCIFGQMCYRFLDFMGITLNISGHRWRPGIFSSFRYSASSPRNLLGQQSLVSLYVGHPHRSGRRDLILISSISVLWPVDEIFELASIWLKRKNRTSR